MDKGETVIEKDVLVIGGGLAGVFAAVYAKKEGVDVALVSKGNIGRCGQSPWASSTFVASPDWEDRIEKLKEQAYIDGEYINNREWTERVINESYSRFNDLVSWGVPFLKESEGIDTPFVDEEGNPVKTGDDQPLWRWAQDDAPGSWVQPLINEPKKLGVNIFEKIMIVDLVKQDGLVAGGIGISVNSREFYVFKAKATIICMGSGGFKPVGSWPIGDLTADGHVMAYRAGADITGKEFEDFHSAIIGRMGGINMPPLPPVVNAEGNIVPGYGFGLNADFEAHAGRAPLLSGKNEVFSNVALGMSIHTAEGIWPVDENCASCVPGLYAAGDSCGTMVTGATYSIMGAGTVAASITGMRAGKAAAFFARQSKKIIIDEQQLAHRKELIRMPAERKGGFSPQWVIQLLRNTMMPYFILRIKHGERLKATLTLIEFMRDDLSPKLFARDPHELRLVHETRNMIINAEMKLRASLFRTESRGTHYREDYPRRTDPDWLAWVLLKDEDGVMKACKKPIPQEWWPDLSKSYEERYPAKFPGE